MRKAIWCAVGLLLVGWALMEPLAIRAQGSGMWNVTTGYVDGDLYYYDKSGNEIFRIDGTNRKVLFPSGSNLDLDAATGILSPAAGEIVSADIATDTIVAGDVAPDAIGTSEILDATVANIDISATAAIARSKLAEDALQPYGITIEQIRSDAGASLTSAETAGTFDITIGTNTILANGEVTDNETEVSVSYFQFVLPPEYVSAGDCTIRLPAALIATGAPTNNGSTLDIEVYEQSDAGAVGADINSTAAVTFAALDTWYNKDFSITATGLVAGDVLNVKITASVIDSEAAGGTIVLNLAPPKVLLDVKG